MKPSHPLAAAIAALLAPGMVSAATITVDASTTAIDGSDGACSLGEAIESADNNSQNGRTGAGECVAGSGDDTIVLPTAQTITLNSALPTVGSNITIVGNGSTVARDSSTTCTGGSASRRFSASGSSAMLSLSNMSVANGCAGNNNGGAIRVVSGATLVLDGVTLRDSTASINSGGAISAVNALVTISNSTISDNSASGGGGAIGLEDSSLQLVDSVLSGNAAGTGGAIFAFQYTGVVGIEISGSTISGNVANNDGGAIYLYYGGELVVTDSTIDGNTATTGRGGGIVADDDTTLSLTDSTLSDNSASTSNGQQLVSSSATTTLTRAIVSGAGTACSLSGGTLSGSDNLASDASCDALGITVVSSDALALGALADNGGPTQTRLPGPSSVAVDAASGCSGTDQRGETRGVDADGVGGSNCDIGAVEVQNTAPSVLADSTATDQDSDVGGNVLANDSDTAADEDSDLAVVAIDGVSGDVGSAVSPAAGGTLTIAADGGFSFSPGSDFIQLDSGDSSTVSVTVSVSDGHATVDADLDIEVSGLNDAPTATAVSGSIGESDTAMIFSFAGSDPDSGEALSYTLVGTPSAGLVANLGDGTFSFDPNGEFEALDAGFSTLVTLAYTVDDGDLSSASTSISITVNGNNDAPVAGDLALATAQGALVTGSAPASDAESDPLTFSLETPPTAGSASVGSSGSVGFNPGSAFNDLDDGESRAASFQFRVTDDSGASDTGTVTVTVNGANDAPVAAAVSGSVTAGNVVVVGFSASDIDGDPLTYALVDGPSEGSATDNGDGTFSFDPATAFDDLDVGESRQVMIQYTANDGSVDSAAATATITVNGINDAPTAADVALAAADIGLTEGSFAGSDADAGATLVYAITSAPAEGSVSDNGDGSFDFDPNGAFDDLSVGATRAVTFEYTVSDGTTTSSAATVTVTVSGSNSAPTASDVALSTDQDSSVDGNFIGGDIDSDDALAYTITSQPAEGMVVNNNDGSFSFDPAAAFDDLAAGDSRQVMFQYTANDGSVDSAAATATITVNGINDAPIAADVALAAADVGLTQGSFDGSDADAGATLVYAISSAPSAGSVSSNGDGSFDFDPNGEFDDLPAAATRSVTFEYTVSDGTVTSSAATVTVTVNGSNNAPTADAVALSTDQDSAVDGSFVGSDVDSGDTLSYAITLAPSEGAVTDHGDGSFSFDPVGAFDDLGAGESRAVSFLYRVSDADASSAPATVTVTINGLNDAPLATADAYSAFAGASLSIDAAAGLLANDSDVDGDPLTVTAGTFIAGGIGGTLVLAADGSFDYTAPAAAGTASFSYTLGDGTTTTAGTLTIEVASATTLDLEISKSDGVDIVAAEEVLIWTISVFNNGPAAAVGARVQDLLPAAVANASWTCEAVPPSAATACANASGAGDIDERVDIASGDAIVFELMATMTAPSTSTLSNTATVTAPDGFSDPVPGNNSATDTDATTRVFANGFESMLAGKRFEARSAEFAASELEARLPQDAGRAPLLVGRAASPGGFVLIHARRDADTIELRLSRFEHGEWQQGAWQRIEQARVRVEW